MKRASITTAAFAGLMGLAGASFAQTLVVAAEPSPSGAIAVYREAIPEQPVSREAVKAEARAYNRDNANTLTPKGEASTVVNHQPNAMPPPASVMSRTEVAMQSYKVRPRFGYPGERPDVPTNPIDQTGTPQ